MVIRWKGIVMIVLATIGILIVHVSLAGMHPFLFLLPPTFVYVAHMATTYAQTSPPPISQPHTQNLGG